MTMERNKFTVTRLADGSWGYQLHPVSGNELPMVRGFKTSKLATAAAKKAARKI